MTSTSAQFQLVDLDCDPPSDRWTVGALVVLGLGLLGIVVCFLGN